MVDAPWSVDYDPPRPEEKPTWGDYGRAFGAGTASAGSAIASGVEHATERKSTEQSDRVIGSINEASKYLRGVLSRGADTLREGMTDIGRQRLTAEITSEEFWRRPSSSAILQLTGMAGSMPLMLFGGPIGAAVAGGAIGSGSAISDIRKLVDDLPEEELRKNPWYNTIRDSGMSEEDARIDLKRKLVGNKGVVNFLVGAVAGAVGPAGKVSGAISGRAAPTLAGEGVGFVRRTATGALEGGATEMAQEGTENISVQEAQRTLDPSKEFDDWALVNSALTGLAGGAVLTGAAGAATGGRARTAKRSGGVPEVTPEVTKPAPTTTRNQKAADAEGVVAVDPAGPTPDQALAIGSRQQPAPRTIPQEAPRAAPREVVDAARRLSRPTEPLPPEAPSGVTPEGPLETLTPPVPPEVVGASERLARVPQEEPQVAPTVEAVPEVVPAPRQQTPEITPETTPEAAPEPATRAPRILPDLRAGKKQSVILPGIAEGAVKLDSDGRLVAVGKDIVGEDGAVGKGRNMGPKARALVEARVNKAKAIVDEHPPADGEVDYVGDAGARDAVVARARAMVSAAKERGFSIPTKIKESIKGDQVTDNPSVQMMVYANDLVRAAKTAKGKRLLDTVIRFKEREEGVLSGRHKEELSKRRAEGEMSMRRDQGDAGEKAVSRATQEDALVGVESVEDIAADRSVGDARVDAKDDAITTRSSVKSAKGAVRGVDAPVEKRVVVSATGEAVEVEGAKAASPVRKVAITPEMQAKYGVPPSKPAPKPVPEATSSTVVDRAAKRTDTSPTEAQKKVGNYEKGVVKWNGMDVAIENPKGSKREGTDPNGTKWSVTMPDHYGYIKRTEGADGDQVDVYLGGNPKSEHVFVIDQKDLRTDKFDEHKVMLGYNDLRSALEAYDKAFSDGRGMERVGNFTVMTVDQFKSWVKSDAPKKARRRGHDQVAEKTQEDIVAARIGDTLPRHTDGSRISVIQTIPATRLLSNLDVSHLSGVPAVLAKLMKRRIMAMANDVPVHFVTEGEMIELSGSANRGLYRMGRDGVSEHIFVNERELDNPAHLAHTVLHELAHAATARAIAENAAIHSHVVEAIREVKAYVDQLPPGIVPEADYALTNPLEFIAEAFSNPSFQELLTFVPVSRELAAKLKLDRTQRFSIWDAIVATVRQAVEKISGKLPEGHRMIDAVMRVGQHIDAENALRRDIERNTGHPVPVQRHGLGADQTLALSLPSSDQISAAVRAGARDFGVNSGGKVRRFKDRASSFFQLTERAGDLFGADRPAEQIFKFRASMEHMKDRILEEEGGARFVRDVAEYQRKHGAEAARELAGVGFDASNFNVNLGRNANNDHLGKDATRGWQAKARLPELQRRFDALPREGQALLERGAALFRKIHNEIALQNIRNVLDVAGINDPGLADRIHKDGLTEADRKRFKDTGHEAIIKALDDAQEVKAIKGWYFPFRRYGQFTSTGYREIATPQGATRISDDTFQFVDPVKGGETAARRMAREFVENHDLRHINTKHVFVDKNDHSKIVEPDDVDAVHAFRVTLQNKHVEFHQTEAEAHLAVADYARQGLINASVGKLDDNLTAMAPDISGRMGTLLDALEKQQRFKDMSADERASLRQALRETAISAMGSTHTRSVFRQRRNVSGMSQDLGRVAADYSQMSANYLAKLRFQPRIDAAFKKLEEYAKEHKYDSNAIRRDEIIETLRRRIYSNNADTFQSNTFANATIRRLLQTTRLARLAGVSFHVINSQEPWTVSLPIIGGRHGFAATSRALIDAYNTIGARGGVVAGLRDTVHAARSDTGFTDYVQFFKDNIRSSKMLGGAKAQRLIEALEYGEGLNLYGNDTKFEVGKYADPTSNIAGRTLDRADLMANQVGSAVEGINRAVTTLAAYQLEYRKNGGNHEAAMEYAYRTAHNTMGDYSAWNAAPIFNTSAGRLALQFKKFSHKMYYLLGKVVGGAVRGDREAMKQFAGLMVTHAVVAGALGLPIEPFKLALVAANTLGLTGFGDDDFEDAVRRVLAEVLGSKGGEIAAHGLPRAFGIDTSSRQGLDSLLTFGAPKSQRVTDVKSWLFDTMAGAPVGYIMDQITSAQALAKGDVVTALEKTVPVRFATDIIKAVSGASGPKLDERGREKRQQLTPWQTAVRAAGFTPSVVSEGYKKSVNYAKAAREQSDQRAEFMAQWAAASPNERARLWGRIEIVNRHLPKEARLTRAQLDKYARRRREEHKTMVNGLRASKATRHIAEGFGHYNTN